MESEKNNTDYEQPVALQQVSLCTISRNFVAPRKQLSLNNNILYEIKEKNNVSF